jgi:hypothetical protein
MNVAEIAIKTATEMQRTDDWSSTPFTSFCILPAFGETDLVLFLEGIVGALAQLSFGEKSGDPFVNVRASVVVDVGSAICCTTGPEVF